MFRLFTEHLSGREYAVSNGRFGNRQRVGNDAEESLIIWSTTAAFTWSSEGKHEHSQSGRSVEPSCKAGYSEYRFANYNYK